MVKDDDAVKAGNGREPMGDDEHDHVGEGFSDGLLDLLICLKVNACGGLVCDDNVGIAKHGAGHGEQLPLAL